MRLIGCDLHASQQSIAILDRDTGAVTEKTLKHEGEAVREFYASIPPPVVVGIEATGSMGWFLRLMEDLAIECRVGHPTAIREAETRRQKHDRRDAALLLQLLAEDRFPAIPKASADLCLYATQHGAGGRGLGDSFSIKICDIALDVASVLAAIDDARVELQSCFPHGTKEADGQRHRRD